MGVITSSDADILPFAPALSGKSIKLISAAGRITDYRLIGTQKT
jgi:hypothetical protein